MFPRRARSSQERRTHGQRHFPRAKSGMEAAGYRWGADRTRGPSANSSGRWRALSPPRTTSRETLGRTTWDVSVPHRHCKELDGGQCPRRPAKPTSSPSVRSKPNTMCPRSPMALGGCPTLSGSREPRLCVSHRVRTLEGDANEKTQWGLFPAPDDDVRGHWAVSDSACVTTG